MRDVLWVLASVFVCITFPGLGVFLWVCGMEASEAIGRWRARRRAAQTTTALLRAEVDELRADLVEARYRASAAEDALRRAECARQEERDAKRTLRRRWRGAVDEARAWKACAVGLGWTREAWINKPRRDRKESVRRRREAMQGTQSAAVVAPVEREARPLHLRDCMGAEVQFPLDTPFLTFGGAMAAIRAVYPDAMDTPVIGAPSRWAALLDAEHARDPFTLEALAASRVNMAHGFARYDDGAWRQVCVWDRQGGGR